MVPLSALTIEHDFINIPIPVQTRVNDALQTIWIGQFSGTVSLKKFKKHVEITQICIKSNYEKNSTLILYSGCWEHSLFMQLKQSIEAHYPHLFTLELSMQDKRIAELEATLREIADGYSAEEDGRPQAFRFSQIARKALHI